MEFTYYGILLLLASMYLCQHVRDIYDFRHEYLMLIERLIKYFILPLVGGVWATRDVIETISQGNKRVLMFLYSSCYLFALQFSYFYYNYNNLHKCRGIIDIWSCNQFIEILVFQSSIILFVSSVLTYLCK